MKNFGKKLLITSLLIPTLLLGKAKAEKKNSPSQLEKNDITFNLDINRKNNLFFNWLGYNSRNIDFMFNFGYKQEEISKEQNYTESWSRFDRNSDLIYQDSNPPKLNSSEKIQAEGIMKDIKDGSLLSYKELLDRTKNFSKNQILVLANVFGGVMNSYNYDLSLKEDPMVSQDDFLNKMHYSLFTGGKTGIGVCRQIHLHIEKFLNDSGIKAAAVTEQDHVFSIAHTKKYGNALINYSSIIIQNTNNLEKLLETYQREAGKAIFEFSFYENAKFKYKHTTREGNRFLELVEFDKSSKPIKDMLTDEVPLEPRLQLSFNKGNHSESYGINSYGFFARTGIMQGITSTPLDKIEFFQTGFKRTLNFPKKWFKIGLNLSYIDGRLHQENEEGERDSFALRGGNIDVIASTQRKKGFNICFRRSFHATQIEKPEMDEDPLLLYENLIGAGVSWRIPLKNFTINPYLAAQWAEGIKDLNTLSQGEMLSEVRSGVNLDIKLSKLSLSLDPYYLKRICENGFGWDIKLGIKPIGITFNGEKTFSNYIFCPDKFNYSLGFYIGYRNFEAGLDFKNQEVDYNGDKENFPSVNFKTSFKF